MENLSKKKKLEETTNTISAGIVRPTYTDKFTSFVGVNVVISSPHEDKSSKRQT